MKVNKLLSRVIAVVPTFHPGDETLARLSVLSEQVDHVIVVDDGSSPTADATLSVIESAGHELVRHADNRGIAAALNTGIRLALTQRADYVLTIDQDSLLPHGYVTACLDVFHGAASATRLGIVTVDSINGYPSIPPRRSPEGYGLVNEAIQSGFLMTAECLTECGLFDEQLFIDCVDTEFCLRIGEHGFRIAIAAGTNLEHELGEQVQFRPFGVPRRRDGVIETYEYHGPYRRYFIVRNNVDLWLRYARKRPRWVVSAVRRELTPSFKTIVSGPQRLRQLTATLAGGIDGLARRRGPMPARLKSRLQRC
ncbi:MAG TPA: glycosyltransferase [Microbacteriaceae bacterium]